MTLTAWVFFGNLIAMWINWGFVFCKWQRTHRMFIRVANAIHEDARAEERIDTAAFRTLGEVLKTR